MERTNNGKYFIVGKEEGGEGRRIPLFVWVGFEEGVNEGGEEVVVGNSFHLGSA